LIVFSLYHKGLPRNIRKVYESKLQVSTP
jgi:hypothetical protein